MQTKHLVTMDNGYQWHLLADFAQAAAPLAGCFFDPHGDDDYQATPYQTADAQHRDHKAAKMVWDYFAKDQGELDMVVEEVRQLETP